MATRTVRNGPAYRRIFAVVMGIALLAAAGAWLGSNRVDRGGDGPPTSIPTSDEVIEQLPPQAAASKRDLRAQRRLSAGGSDVDARVGLAQRHLQRARIEGDPREIGLAQSALGPWWQEQAPPLAIRPVRAAIRQYQHDFDGALADLAEVISQQPADIQSWLSRAAIQQTTGRLAEAEHSCREVVARADHLFGHVCLADLASLRGDGGAFDRVMAQVQSRPVAPGDRQWTLTVLAEMAERIGRSDAIDALFRAAVAAGTDSYARVAYADRLLATQRNADAAALLEVAPATDAVLLRRAIAWQRLSDPRAAAAADELRQRFASSVARGDSLHLREMARFALEIDQMPQRALEYARRNWSLQKEPADALLLAAAARAAGKPDAADPIRRFARDPGLHDVRLDALL